MAVMVAKLRYVGDIIMDAIAKESNKKPEIIVFAGPNGSGKSTFTDLLKPPVDYINADEIKKNLKCDDLTAAQIAEKQREDHLKNRRTSVLKQLCLHLEI